jgi:hypothetical protein
MEWHHIVEQTPGNLARFGAARIHTTGNYVRLDAGVHREISGFYSSVQPRITGSQTQTVREWIGQKGYQAQMDFGNAIVRTFAGL